MLRASTFCLPSSCLPALSVCQEHVFGATVALCMPFIACFPGLEVVVCRCLVDSKPRQLDAESCNLLCNFAELVARELDRGSHSAPDPSSLPAKDLTGIMLVDVSAPKWSILYTSALWQRITGELIHMYVSCGRVEKLTTLFNLLQSYWVVHVLLLNFGGKNTHCKLTCISACP